MYKYNHDADGIYVVVNGNQYKLEYDCSSIGTTSSKCAKCDFFSGSCKASESCRRIESQFPDSYWKLTNSKYILCNEDPSLYIHDYSDQIRPICLTCEDTKGDDSEITYTVYGDDFINLDFSQTITNKDK